MRSVAAVSLLTLLSASLTFAQAADQPKKDDPRKAEDMTGGGALSPPAKPSKGSDCPLRTLVETGECPALPKAAARKSALPAADILLNLAQEGRLSAAPGMSQGLTEAALNEAVQILGQIVVDRASQEAFRQLQNRLVKLLACAGNGAQYLPTTCDALQALRVQDVAMAPQVLTSALVADVASQLLRNASSNFKAGADANPSATNLLAVVQRDIAPLAFRGERGLDARMATLSLSQLRSKGLAILAADAGTLCDHPTSAAKAADAALGFATAATAACFLQSDDSPAACSAGQVVSSLFNTVCGKKGDPAVEAAAETLAVDLITMGAALTDQKKPDIKRRLRAANDGLFDFLCLSFDFENGCPASAKAPTQQWALQSLRTLFGSVIEGEPLQTVVRTAGFVRQFLPEDDARRGVRLLSGLLDYAITVDPANAPSTTGTTGTASTNLHDQRTKILESLTADMTDRTGRLGDSIFSVGGALRVVGGVWLDQPSRVFYGPLSLPLGFALDDYFANKAYGIHLEATALDLGHYLTFDDGGKVRDVDVAQALAPGAGAAFFWGTSLPVTLGVNASYAPSYQSTDTAKHGAFNVALTFGIYVPLLDLN